MESSVVVGALARIQPSFHASVKRELVLHNGVTTFDLEGEDKLGILIEADSLDDAHARITKDLRHAEGVLGVWPISVELDPEISSASEASPEQTVVDEESDEQLTS